MRATRPNPLAQVDCATLARWIVIEQREIVIPGVIARVTVRVDEPVATEHERRCEWPGGETRIARSE